MKIKIKPKTHALYHYIVDLDATLMQQLNIFASSNTEHPAFYIQLPVVDIQNKTWRCVDQHVTIERDINPAYAFLSPSHFTMTLIQNSDPNISCTIHAYFDHNVNFNGTILKTFRKNGVTLNEAIDLDLDHANIQILAHDGVQKICELVQMKAQAYLNLTKEVELLDHRLQAYLYQRQPIQNTQAKRQEMIALINEYTKVLEQRDRYRDTELRDDWSYLSRLTDAIQTLSITDSTSNAGVVIQDETNIKQACTDADIAPAVTSPPSIDSIKIDEKIQLTQQLEQILAAHTKMSIDERIHLSQAIQRLDIELLLYDLTHDNPEDQLFVQSIRNRIPYDPSNIDSFFAQSVLDGELSRVKQLYENINLKIDFVDLFEKLITLIEDGSPKSAKLIHVADYFHQTSELYRSYLLFRLSNQMLRLPIEFENISGVSTGKITVNRLALMYLNDRKEAFALFLRHGFSPLGCHAYFGNIGFNALQMILLASTSGPDVIPYIDLLFEYGANIHTPKIVLPTTYYIINLHNQSQSSACDIFRHLKKGSPSKIKFTAKSTVENLSSAQKKLLTVLSDYMNILDFAIHLKHPQSDRIVENLAERCDLKTRMIELCNILKQDSVEISIIPTRQGGCFFYKSEAEYLKKCKFLEPLRKQEDDIIVMELLPSAIQQLQSMPSLEFFRPQCDKFSVVTHNKTMSIHLCPNPEYSIDQTQRILAIAQSIHDISKKTFTALSMEMQREHVDSLRRLAIEAQLKGDLVQTSAYYLGSIIAISWIQPLLLRDYKILFAILFQYGSVIEKSVKLIKTNTNVLEDMTINTTHLFSHLHDAIKIELMSTKIMGIAIAEDSKAELTK